MDYGVQMKKVLSYIGIFLIIFLLTFRFHVGKLPILTQVTEPTLFKILLFLGADINAHKKGGDSVFLYNVKQVNMAYRDIKAYKGKTKLYPIEKGFLKMDQQTLEERPKIIRILLENSDVDIKWMLFKASAPITIEMLLDAGADIEELNGHGITPLEYNAYLKDVDTVKFLISKGAKIDKSNKYLRKILEN